MIIKIKWSKADFYSYFLIQKYYFHSVLNAKIPRSCFPNCAHFFYKDHMNMSFHGNRIEDIVAILLLKTFHWHSKWNTMECFWRILSMTTGFYTKS